MYYTNYKEMGEDEIFMAALMSKNFTELYDIISNILSGSKLNRFMESVINISKEWIPLYEWEKEKMDKLVEDATKEVAYNEGTSEKEVSIIKSMLKKKMSYEDISDITNKTIEEIKEIEKSIKE